MKITINKSIIFRRLYRRLAEGTFVRRHTDYDREYKIITTIRYVGYFVLLIYRNLARYLSVSYSSSKIYMANRNTPLFLQHYMYSTCKRAVKFVRFYSHDNYHNVAVVFDSFCYKTRT